LNLKISYLRCISSRRGHSPDRVPLPAPIYNRTSSSISGKSFRSNSFQQNVSRSTDYGYDSGVHNRTGPSTSSFHDNKVLRQCFPMREASIFNLNIVLLSNLNVIITIHNHCWPQVCPICLTDPKDMAFGCGHQVKI
jgi:E3 ubiquitin-protein ligase RGLG